MTIQPFTPTDEQYAAIEFPSSMVVTARPGSGKTAVVASKIRRILPSLPGYQGVVAISYTNKASDELKRRSKEGAIDSKSSFFGTIDEFCINEIIRPFASHVFEKHCELQTVKSQDLPESLSTLRPSKPVAEAYIKDTRSFLPFFRACHEQGVIALEAVGMLAYFILNDSAACLRYIKSRYVAIFVDEYQDSGYFQHRLFVCLKENGLNAIAVGDADQSIFLFARKNPTYLLSLTNAESGFKPFSLTINHRSHASITAYARRLLDQRSQYFLDPNNRVYRVNVPGSQYQIAQWLKDNIPRAAKHFSVTSLDRIGILCANSQTAKIVADNIGIPHRLYEEGPFGPSPNHEAKLFMELLAFRFDLQRNAQEIIQRNVRDNLNSSKLRKLRAKILQCRNSPIEQLYDNLCYAVVAIFGNDISIDARNKLREICNNSKALSWFNPPNPHEVQILTLHKSKGLEFNVVFHLDLYDWILPRRVYLQGVWDPIFENEQQCLNLHYVGITRAIDACFLITSTRRINSNGELKNASPSQFFGRNGVVAHLI